MPEEIRESGRMTQATDDGESDRGSVKVALTSGGVTEQLVGTGSDLAVAIGALAVGALAFGAVAVGALAIGQLAVGRLILGRSRVHSLEIEELNVKRLRVGELIVTDRLGVPGKRRGLGPDIALETRRDGLR